VAALRSVAGLSSSFSIIGDSMKAGVLKCKVPSLSIGYYVTYRVVFSHTTTLKLFANCWVIMMKYNVNVDIIGHYKNEYTQDICSTDLLKHIYIYYLGEYIHICTTYIEVNYVFNI